MLDAARHRPPSRLTLTDLSFRIVGVTGIVRGLNTQMAPDGKVIGRVRFTDIFPWHGGRWQAIAAQEAPVATEYQPQE